MYSALKVLESFSPGLRVIGPPVTATSGSMITIVLSDTLPVLVTEKLYLILSPACAKPSPFVSLKTADFIRVIPEV